MKYEKKLIAVLLVLVLLFSTAVVAYAADADGGIVESIFSGLKEAANFLKRLIVLDANYFHNKLGDLSARVNERFGGLAYLYLMLNDFFTSLRNAPTIEFMMNIPNNFLYRGYKGISLNFFTSAKPYISFLRGTLTASSCLFTAVICYKKLLTFFNR